MRQLLAKRVAVLTMALVACLSVGVAFAATGPRNSRESSALFDLSSIAPGDSRSENVTISNPADAPAAFSLGRYGLSERPGLGGGRLSERLDLRVEQLSNQAAAATVHRGSLASMSRVKLGTFEPGESRTYRFTVSFSDHGTDDNAYAGGSVSFGLRWRTTETAPR